MSSTSSRPGLGLASSIALVSALALAISLGDSSMVHCSKLDPSHPIALSNYFDARGFPFPWLVTSDGTCGGLGAAGLILWSELLQSAFVIVALTSVVVVLRHYVRNSRSRQNR